MLKEHHLTTPLIHPEERAPLRVIPAKKPSPFRALWIFGKVFQFSSIYFRLRISRRYTAVGWARQFRHFIEEMGGIWIKAGQVLAMRNDLFSQDFCNELGHLQDRAFAFPSADALRLIEESLGRPISQVFEEFDPNPFAAASLSQVHKGKLRRGGFLVAIKVQRPFAGELFRYDLWWLARFFGLLQSFKGMEHYHWDEMIEAVREMMEEELDYRFEASNMREFRKTLKKHKVYVPKVWLDYSSGTVLVMEYLRAVFMSDYVKVQRNEPSRLNAWLRENEINPRRLARRLFHSQLRQIYEDLFFHGDPHPGNIVLLRNNRFALIDFGNAGRIDKDFSEKYQQFLGAYSQNQMSTAADMYLIMAGQLSPILNVELVKKELVRAFHRQKVRSGLKNLPFHERSLAGNAAELSQVAATHKFALNWNLLKMGRALGGIDQNIGVLNEAVDYTKETERYLRKAAKRRAAEPSDLLPKLMEQVSFLGTIIKPTMLSKAMNFGALVSNGTRVAAAFFKFISLILWVVLFAVIWVYLYQHHFYWVKDIHTSDYRYVHLLQKVPPIAAGIWYLIALFLIVNLRLATFIRHMLKPPARTLGDRP